MPEGIWENVVMGILFMTKWELLLILQLPDWLEVFVLVAWFLARIHFVIWFMLNYGFAILSMPYYVVKIAIEEFRN